MENLICSTFSRRSKHCSFLQTRKPDESRLQQRTVCAVATLRRNSAVVLFCIQYSQKTTTVEESSSVVFRLAQTHHLTSPRHASVSSPIFLDPALLHHRTIPGGNFTRYALASVTEYCANENMAVVFHLFFPFRDGLDDALHERLVDLTSVSAVILPTHERYETREHEKKTGKKMLLRGIRITYTFRRQFEQCSWRTSISVSEYPGLIYNVTVLHDVRNTHGT